VRLLTQAERRVYAYILSLVPRWADAEEILQETNVRLWEQFADFQPGADFGSWACTVAYYQVLTFRKRVRREQSHLSQEFVELVAEESRQSADEIDLRVSALEECMAKLLPSQRQLLNHCYGSRLSIKDASKQLNRSIAAVYKSLERIRLLLHECIERRLREERST
jgi:RNA polymerase sigma-70 factor (ECF subfamily)